MHTVSVLGMLRSRLASLQREKKRVRNSCSRVEYVQKPRMIGLGNNWEHKSPAKLRQRGTEEGADKSPGWMCLCHIMKPSEPRGKA